MWNSLHFASIKDIINHIFFLVKINEPYVCDASKIFHLKAWKQQTLTWESQGKKGPDNKNYKWDQMSAMKFCLFSSQFISISTIQQLSLYCYSCRHFCHWDAARDVDNVTVFVDKILITTTFVSSPRNGEVMHIFCDIGPF